MLRKIKSKKVISVLCMILVLCVFFAYIVLNPINSEALTTTTPNNPNGVWDGFVYIKINGTSYKIDMTVSNSDVTRKSQINNTQRWITLSGAVNGNFLTQKDSSGYYTWITFSMDFTVPAHYYAEHTATDSYVRSDGSVGTFTTSLSNAGHQASNHTATVTCTVSLHNAGIITDSENKRHRGASTTIEFKRSFVPVSYCNGYGGGWVKIADKWCGENLSGLPASLDRPFYRFTGWKDEHGHWHTPNSTVCTGGDWFAWLTAQWEDYYYKIQYNSNGSGQDSQTQKVDRNDAKVELYDDVFSRTHYEFTGWNTNAGGTGTNYALGSTVNHLTTTNKATVNLYAQWRYLTHTIKFDGNGATSGSMTDQTIDEGDPQELRVNAFKRKGYYFCGWSTQKDGGAEYRDEGTFAPAKNTGGQTTTLYAVWSRDGSFQVDNVIDDTSMFEGCDTLEGGNGTKYDYNHSDSKEANIDIPSDRGYFTAK